jgi:hypothetical protein
MLPCVLTAKSLSGGSPSSIRSSASRNTYTITSSSAQVLEELAAAAAVQARLGLVLVGVEAQLALVGLRAAELVVAAAQSFPQVSLVLSRRSQTFPDLLLGRGSRAG